MHQLCLIDLVSGVLACRTATMGWKNVKNADHICHRTGNVAAVAVNSSIKGAVPGFVDGLFLYSLLL
jgi:hypothetical protein